jgi:hypothetical protein
MFSDAFSSTSTALFSFLMSSSLEKSAAAAVQMHHTMLDHIFDV